MIRLSKASMTAGRVRLLCSAWLACFAALALTGQAQATSYSPSDAFYWSTPGGGAATAIATSSDGNSVYVVDATAKRIAQFDSDGNFVRWWAYRKAFGAPSSVTTDAFGHVYVLFPKSETIVKYSGDGKKVLASWNAPFAGSIAATRGGSVWVLSNFLNAVGEYNSAGKSIGGLVANLPGQWFPQVGSGKGYTEYWPQSGYDAPYKTVATAIAVDPSGDPVVVGASYQSLANPEPDCSVADSDFHIDTHPYPDPLVSGEATRFTPGGTPLAYGWLSESQQNCWNGIWQVSPGHYAAYGWQSDATDPRAVAVDPNTGDVYAVSPDDLGVIHLDQGLFNFKRNVNAPSYYCSSIDCSARNWDLLAGNPPAGVAIDCRSDLYMLGGGAVAA